MKATSDNVRKEMARILSRKVETIKDEMQLKQLVAESFVLIELVIELQDVFEVRINQEEMPQIETVANLIELIIKKTA